MHVDNKKREIGYDGKNERTLWTRHFSDTRFSFVIHSIDDFKNKTELVCNGKDTLSYKEAEIRESVAAFEDWLRETLDAPIKI